MFIFSIFLACSIVVFSNAAPKPDSQPEPLLGRLTCATVKCAGGSTCQIVDNQPQCLPSNQTTTTTTLTCATVKCAGGSTCQIVDNQPQCTPSNQTSTLTCATVKCAGGSTCQIVDNHPKCVGSNKTTTNNCAATTCPVGSVCQEVACFVAPCNPVCVPATNGTQENCSSNEIWSECGSSCEPTCDNRSPMCTFECLPAQCQCDTGFFRLNGTCVTENDCDSSSQASPVFTCANMLCPTETPVCVMQEVTCIMAPCNPVPTCVTTTDSTTNEPASDVSLENTTVCTGQNEEHKTCGACDQQCNEPQRMCKLLCLPEGACGCIDGFVRNSASLCVAKNECPLNNTICGENEIMAECGNRCEPHCGDVGLRMCPAICGPPACACTGGFFRNSDGKCVEEDQCSTNNNTNTCDTKQCEPGQVCIMNSVRCIRAPCPEIPTCIQDESLDSGSNSTETCTEHERWDMCGGCEGTCDDPQPRCTRECNPGRCVCAFPRVRHNGQCIAAKRCLALNASSFSTTFSSIINFYFDNITHHNCSMNEVWNDCPGCEGTCEVPNPMCTDQCGTSGCHCHLPNFVRGPYGRCISVQKCEKRLELYYQKKNYTLSHGKCGSNEQFLTCGTMCEPSCDNPEPELCADLCVSNVCQCKTGFVRNSQGDCVKKEDCSLTTGANTCAETTCPANTTCQDVQCFVPPCNPICVPDTENDPIPADCSTITCIANSICKDVNGTAQCVPIDGEITDTCNMFCVMNSECQIIDGQAQCVPVGVETDIPDECASMRCMSDTECKRVNGIVGCYSIPNNSTNLDTV